MGRDPTVHAAAAAPLRPLALSSEEVRGRSTHPVPRRCPNGPWFTAPRYLFRGPARGPLASGLGMTVAPCRWDDLGGGVTGSEGCRRRR